MKKSTFAAALFGVAVLTGLNRPSQAAIILTIDHVVVPAGSTAVVGVYASTTTDDIMSGFNLPLDINDDGENTTLPAGFTLADPDLTNSVYSNTGLDMPPDQIALINVDAIPTGSGANIQLTSTPQLLFDLDVDVASTVPGGTVVPLEIEAPSAPYGPLFNIASPNGATVQSPTPGAPATGSITVAAVPEPSSICAGLAVIATIATRRRRKAQ